MTVPGGIVVWFTGLPAAGKSSLAERVRQRIAPRRACVLLDSDAVRRILGVASYDENARDAFYRTLGELAGLLARQGLVVLVAATAARRQHRELARAAAPRFVEVWVRTPVETCAARDPKGLYARAAAGAAPSLPGAGAPYEPPLAPEVTAEGGFDADAIATIDRLVATAVSAAP